jgi:hypothetical protein
MKSKGQIQNSHPQKAVKSKEHFGRRGFFHIICSLLPVGSIVVAGCPDLDEETDAGMTISDGGQESDAGVDPNACLFDENSPLGDFTLASGYSVVDVSRVSSSIMAIAALSTAASTEDIYALDTSTNQVVHLGQWPTLGDNTLVFDLVRNQDQSETTFASGFLVTNGQYLAAGYTLPFDANTGVAPGHIAIYDTAAGETEEPLVHINADNNFHANFLDSYLIVNGSSIDGNGSTNGVYAWDLIASTSIGQVAAFPGDASASGYTIVPTGDVVGLGYYDASFTNQMKVIGKASLVDAIGSMATVSLDGKASILSDGFLLADHMGNDLVFANGYYDDSFQLVQGNVVLVPISSETTGGETSHQAGEASAIVSVPANTCQRIAFLSSIKEDLIIAISDDHPTEIRAVRITRD